MLFGKTDCYSVCSHLSWNPIQTKLELLELMRETFHQTLEVSRCGLYGKSERMGKFHHGPGKALTVNSVIHQGRVISCSARWQIKNLYRCCMDYQFSNIGRNMEKHQNIAVNKSSLRIPKSFAWVLHSKWEWPDMEYHFCYLFVK